MQEGPGRADDRGKRNASAEGLPSPAPPNPPPPPLDFGTYMAVKSAKLRVQFDEQRAEKRRRATGPNEPLALSSSSPSSMAATSEIFRGVVIHVNGLTVPCALVRRVESVEEKALRAVSQCIVPAFAEKKRGQRFRAKRTISPCSRFAR